MDADELAVGAAESEALRAHDARLPPADDPRHRVSGEAILDESHGGLQHVDLDAPALACPPAFHQRAKHPIGRIHAGRIVGDGGAEGFRRLRIDKEAGDAAQRLADRVEGGAVLVGPLVAEAGDRAMDEPRIARFESCSVESHLVEDGRAKIVDQNIRASDEFEQRLAVLGLGRVEHDALLVAIVGDEGRAILPAMATPEGISLGSLHLDHLGTEIGEHHGRQWSGDEIPEFDDAQPFEHHLFRFLSFWPAGIIAPVGLACRAGRLNRRSADWTGDPPLG